MAGNLDLDTLKKDVKAGAIDTVVACFVDMQGRLIGKRVTGHYFLDQVVDVKLQLFIHLSIDLARSKHIAPKHGESA